ncbi:MAG: hypothetical protein IPH12_01240 [Saprospirales bacterium]|nr:hypothetical protein [Saprospirales bacterium]
MRLLTAKIDAELESSRNFPLGMHLTAFGMRCIDPESPVFLRDFMAAFNKFLLSAAYDPIPFTWSTNNISYQDFAISGNAGLFILSSVSSPKLSVFRTAPKGEITPLDSLGFDTKFLALSHDGGQLAFTTIKPEDKGKVFFLRNPGRKGPRQIDTISILDWELRAAVPKMESPPVDTLNKGPQRPMTTNRYIIDVKIYKYPGFNNHKTIKGNNKDKNKDKALMTLLSSLPEPFSIKVEINSKPDSHLENYEFIDNNATWPSDSRPQRNSVLLPVLPVDDDVLSPTKISDFPVSDKDEQRPQLPNANPSHVPADIIGLTFSSNTPRLIISCSDSTYIFDMDKIKRICTFYRTSGSSIRPAIAISRMFGNIVIEATLDDIKIWDYASGKVTLRANMDNQKPVTDLEIMPDQKTLISSAEDGSLKFWNLETGLFIKAINLGGDEIRKIAVSSDGAWIASGFSGGNVSVWRADNGNLILDLPIKNKRSSVTGLKFLPGTRRLLVSYSDGNAYLWDLDPKAIEANLRSKSQSLSGKNFPVETIERLILYDILVSNPWGIDSLINSRDTAIIIGIAEYLSAKIKTEPDFNSAKTFFYEAEKLYQALLAIND